VGAVAAGGRSSGGGTPAAVAMLPSVTILGHCCMQWAEQLQKDPTELLDPAAMQLQQQHHHWGPQLPFLRGLAVNMLILQQWLQTGSTCEQLTAAGFGPLPVLQQLDQLAAACVALQKPLPDTSWGAKAIIGASAQQLHSIGTALCAFAVTCMCNNPGCTSMAGLSDLGSVSGRSCICAGCLVARYCGRACQWAAWKQHKPVCGALSAAADCGAVSGAGD
jgi:hypothetical protein